MLTASDRVYSIGEVSEILGVESHTLRFWEKEFKDFIKPRRNGRRARVYRPGDIEPAPAGRCT